MKYNGKATLTLRMFNSVPRRMTVATDHNVQIAERDGRTIISVQLAETGLKVDEIDVSVGQETHSFVVDSTTHLETQYQFYCFPASA